MLLKYKGFYSGAEPNIYHLTTGCNPLMGHEIKLVNYDQYFIKFDKKRIKTLACTGTTPFEG